MATATAQKSIATLVPTGTWKTDPVHSSVGFSVKHMVVATFRGGFADYDITLANEDGEPKIYGSVDVASVEVRDENLNAHLLAPDFFDAERHPEIKFASTDIRVNGEDIVVSGDLTIKGTTRRVEARGRISEPVEHPAAGERLGLELETTVDRNEFGLDWNAPGPKGGLMVENDVTLSVQLELAKEEA
jgi:polyisoprenoid-binding protein YceI